MCERQLTLPLLPQSAKDWGEHANVMIVRHGRRTADVTTTVDVCEQCFRGGRGLRRGQRVVVRLEKTGKTGRETNRTKKQ